MKLSRMNNQALGGSCWRVRWLLPGAESDEVVDRIGDHVYAFIG